MRDILFIFFKWMHKCMGLCGPGKSVMVYCMGLDDVQVVWDDHIAWHWMSLVNVWWARCMWLDEVSIMCDAWSHYSLVGPCGTRRWMWCKVRMILSILIVTWMMKVGISCGTHVVWHPLAAGFAWPRWSEGVVCKQISLKVFLLCIKKIIMRMAALYYLVCIIWCIS